MHKAQIIIENAAGIETYNQLHTAPASWKEMTREHLLQWASVMGSKLRVDAAKVQLASRMFGIPKKQFAFIKESDTWPLSEAVGFLLKKNMLSNWLIPAIWHRLFKYYGPKNKLANLTIHEYKLCEHCYESYGATANIEYLDTLVAILYRPQRFFHIDDDIRVKLTNYGYVKRAKRFKKLHLGLKYAIYLNYEGCRNCLHQAYPDVFIKGGKVVKNKKPQITPWPKIIESAANDIFGPLSTTETTNLHTFLSRLGTRIKDQRELDEKTRKK